MKPCNQADALNLSVEERRFVTKNNYLVTGENLFEHCDRLAVALEPYLLLLDAKQGFTESAAALLQQRLMEIRISHPVTNEKDM